MRKDADIKMEQCCSFLNPVLNRISGLIVKTIVPLVQNIIMSIDLTTVVLADNVSRKKRAEFHISHWLYLGWSL